MMEEPAAGVLTQRVAVVRGTRLGPYEVMDLIGAGGMGEVYRARDTRLERDVALKVLPDDRAGRGAERDRFEREARALAALSHPHISAFPALGEEGECPTSSWSWSKDPHWRSVSRGALFPCRGPRSRSANGG